MRSRTGPFTVVFFFFFIVLLLRLLSEDQSDARQLKYAEDFRLQQQLPSDVSW